MAIAGAVLAGGRSSRVGRDKAFITVDGVPLAARTAAILAEAGCDPVHIVGRQTALSDLGWPVVRESGTDHHPLYGVAASLRAQPGQLVLHAPCDVINLAVSHIEALLRIDGPCVAVSAGTMHPLLGIFPASYAARASVLADHGAPAWRLCETLPRVILDAPDLIDANHRTDLPR